MTHNTIITPAVELAAVLRTIELLWDNPAEFNTTRDELVYGFRDALSDETLEILDGELLDAIMEEFTETSEEDSDLTEAEMVALFQQFLAGMAEGAGLEVTYDGVQGHPLVFSLG